MKKLVVVVVVLAAILLLAPFGVGKLAEKRMNHGLDRMAEQVGYLVVVDRKWTGGWFKSRQEVTFEVSPAFAQAMNADKIEEIFNEADAAGEPAGEAEDAPAADEEEAPASDSTEATDDSAPDAAEPEAPAPANPLRFKVFNDVLHGPVLGLSGFGVARVDTTLDLSPETQAKIREVFGPKKALDIRTRVGFFGGGTTTFTSEGRTIKTKDDDDEISYDTVKLALGYGRNGDSYDIDGKMPKFQVKSKDGKQVLITAVTLDGDGERVKGDLYDGDFEFRIGEIKFDEPTGNSGFSVEDAHYEVEMDTENNFVTMAAKMGTGPFKNAALSSSGLELKEVHYDFSLRRLHADSLEKMFRSMRDVYSVTPENKTPEEVQAAIMEPMKEHGVELLKHDPEFSIDRVGFVTPEGEGVLKGLIKFVGVTPEDFSAPGGMAVLAKLDADLTIEVAVKLAEKIPNGATMAGAAVDSGYAKRDGEKYVCHILFKNGELTINGKPQAIPGLGGPPAGAMGNPEEAPAGE
jgi:uncharacterized protein YdgA (DUF945 family)